MPQASIKLLALGLAISLSACMSTEEKKKAAEEEGNAIVAIKSKLLKGAGDALKSDGKEAAESASEGVGEVIKGVNTGFDKSLNQANVTCDSTFLQTFELGRTDKVYNGNDSDTSNAKRVSVYLIANEAFEGKVKLKAYDAAGLEIGRSSLEITLDEDDAKYFDFEFDQRIPLLQADKFVIEKK